MLEELLILKAMKKNMGSYDKLIRLGLSIVLIILYYKGIFVGILGIISLVVALYLTITSLVGICLFYGVFGINTYKTEVK